MSRYIVLHDAVNHVIGQSVEGREERAVNVNLMVQVYIQWSSTVDILIHVSR